MEVLQLPSNAKNEVWTSDFSNSSTLLGIFPVRGPFVRVF